jgi:hypothetical protein
MKPNGRPLSPGTDLARDSRRVVWILTEAARVRREAKHAKPSPMARFVAWSRSTLAMSRALNRRSS